MIDISSTMLELSNDRATQEEAQDVARCLRISNRSERVFMWQRSRKRPQPLSRGHGWCVWTGWRTMRCTE